MHPMKARPKVIIPEHATISQGYKMICCNGDLPPSITRLRKVSSRPRSRRSHGVKLKKDAPQKKVTKTQIEIKLVLHIFLIGWLRMMIAGGTKAGRKNLSAIAIPANATVI